MAAQCDWARYPKLKQKAKEQLPLFGIVAASIVFDTNSQNLLFSLLFAKTSLAVDPTKTRVRALLKKKNMIPLVCTGKNERSVPNFSVV